MHRIRRIPIAFHFWTPGRFWVLSSFLKTTACASTLSGLRIRRRTELKLRQTQRISYVLACASARRRASTIPRAIQFGYSAFRAHGAHAGGSSSRQTRRKGGSSRLTSLAPVACSRRRSLLRSATISNSRMPSAIPRLRQLREITPSRKT